MPLTFARLILGVNDLDRSEAFYRDALGLVTQRRGENVAVEWPEFLLLLEHRPPTTRAKFQCAFRAGKASDVDACAERLRAHGAAIISGPASNNGARRLFVLDPDDYEIEIYSEEP